MPAAATVHDAQLRSIPVRGLLGWATLLLGAGPAAAAGCDHVIQPDTETAKGGELGVGPGDSLRVRGGARRYP